MLTSRIFSGHYYDVSERIEDTNLPDSPRSEEDRFEDALRLLARIIAKDLLRKQSIGCQGAPPQTKAEEGIDDD